MKNQAFEATFPIIKTVVKEDMKSKTEANLSFPNYEFTYNDSSENIKPEELTARLRKMENTSPKNIFRILIKETANAEMNSKILYNRISILRNEEKKIWKKIDEMKRKTQELIQVARQKEKSKKNRIFIKLLNSTIIQDNKRKVSEVKESRNLNKDVIKNMIDKSKRRQSELVKLSSIEMDKKIIVDNGNCLNEKKGKVADFKKNSLKNKDVKAKYIDYQKRKSIYEYFYKTQMRQLAIMKDKETEVKNLKEFETSLLKRFEVAQIEGSQIMKVFSDVQKYNLIKNRNLNLSLNSKNSLYSSRKLIDSPFGIAE